MIIHSRRTASGRLVSLEYWTTWTTVVMDQEEEEVMELEEHPTLWEAVKAYVALPLLLLVLMGCGKARSEAFDPTPHQLPNLQLYFARSIPVVHRLDAVDAARLKQQSLNSTVVALMTAIYGVSPHLPTPRRCYVHARALRDGPALSGYVEDNDFHVLLGEARELPAFLRWYTHALYFPTDVHEQSPTYLLNGQPRTLWDDVEVEEDQLNRQLRFLRGIP